MNLIIFLFFVVSSCQAEKLECISAVEVDKSDYNYEETLDKYKVSEDWGTWSMPIGGYSTPIASSTLLNNSETKYSIRNIQDYDLNTAWIPANQNYGIGDFIEITFNYGEEGFGYGSAYQFYGICNLFNGYCKSLKVWNANSRVKKFKVYYNNIPICYVELIDTWHFQSFDIGKFFINKNHEKYLDAPFEITEGDILKFEIVEVYKGDKYSDVAISEFLCEGAGN